MSGEDTIDSLSQKFDELRKGPREEGEGEGEGEGDDSSSPISRLPDDTLLQILNKLIDLKSLCFCYLVSRRFSSIVLQVDAISFDATLLNPEPVPGMDPISDVSASTAVPSGISAFYSKSFLYAMGFLFKFRRVKSLSIQLRSSCDTAIDNRCLFKWKGNFGSRVESFIILSPNSICDKNGFYFSGNEEEEEEEEEEEHMGLTNDLLKPKFEILVQCMNDGMLWHMMSIYFVKGLPMVEKVSFTDLGKRGRHSLSGEKLNQVKEWANTTSKTSIKYVEVPHIMSYCYIPVLKLPVSGYVMKGLYAFVMELKDVQGGNDGLINSENGFEDKEEAAYTEAVMEVLEKHKGMMRTHDFGERAVD